MKKQEQEYQGEGLGKNDKMMSALAYVIFFLPWILVKKRSNFLNFHINQGFILFVISLLGILVLHTIPFLIILTPIWMLTIILLIVIGVLNAFHGRFRQLPFIGHIFVLVK